MGPTHPPRKKPSEKRIDLVNRRIGNTKKIRKELIMEFKLSTQTRPCAVCAAPTNLCDPDVGTPLCCSDCANRYWREISITCSEGPEPKRRMVGELILAHIGIFEDFIEKFAKGSVPEFDSGCAISAPNNTDDKVIMDSLSSLGRTVYAIIRVRDANGDPNYSAYLFVDDEDVQKAVDSIHAHRDSLEHVVSNLGSGIFRVRAFSPDAEISTVCVRRKAGAIVLEENVDEE